MEEMEKIKEESKDLVPKEKTEIEKSERKTLFLLNPREYEHGLDKKALNTLEGTPGLEKIVRKINKHGVERVIRLSYTGSYLRVNDTNFPDIYNILMEACDNIQLKNIPELYIQWDYAVNARAVGSENPIIILNSGAVDLLSKDELLWLIGHEVGHIKSGHMLYHDMALVIPILGDIIGSATLGIGGLVSSGIMLALLYWYRMSELTADRAGLLACQDLDVAINTMMKMSGVPKSFFDKIKKEDYIAQARQFKDFDYDALDNIAKTAMIMIQDHPWTVMRASELLIWVDSGKYEKLIEIHSKMAEGNEDEPLTCLKCGSEIKDDDKFCPDCGEKTYLFCPKCNAKLDGTRSFCSSCGTKLRILGR